MSIQDGLTASLICLTSRARFHPCRVLGNPSDSITLYRQDLSCVLPASALHYDYTIHSRAGCIARLLLYYVCLLALQCHDVYRWCFRALSIMLLYIRLPRV